MIEKTWLIQALAIGIPYKDFWGMTPRIVRQHLEAHQKHMDEVNMMMYVQGLYVRDAIASSVCNSLKPKNTKPFEYPSQPYELHEKVLTEEEKKDQIKEFFAGMMARKERFDAKKNKS